MNIEPINYSGLPGHIQDAVRSYIEDGLPPGSFLEAVICNDLRESFGCADSINRERMFDIVCWFLNEPPGKCWGSKERYADWMVARHADWMVARKPEKS